MSKIVNYKEMIGTKKDMLTIIDVERKYWTGFNQPVWVIKCECECGNITEMPIYNLKHVKSCGCSKIKYDAIKKGDKIAKLTILEKYGKINNKLFWKCKCECGNETIVNDQKLKSGHTKSCGKCKHINVSIGDRFGKLLVLEYMGKIIKDGTKAPDHYYKCRCDCGNIPMIRHTNLVRGLSKSCGCDTALNNKDPRSSNPEILKFFRVAAALVDRCRNPYNKNFPKYGGRGIKCLLGENNFDVAETLSRLSGYFDGAQIDRINNNGNYEMGNVRWVTSKVNNNNNISSIPKLSIFDISYRLIPKSRIIKYINKTKYSLHDFKIFTFEHEDIDLSSYVLVVSNKLDESECIEHILSCYSDYGVNLTYKEIDIQQINNEQSAAKPH